MKKLSTLLLLIVSFLSISKSSIAQNTTCNAEFNIVYQTANTIQFNPVTIGDALTTQHYWIFGDGSVANVASPNHTYASTGTYTAKHIIIRFANGVEICRDSAFRVITIQGPNPTNCNLVANFTITPVTASPNTFLFTNTSTPLNNTDSIRWTFGDGTSSNDANPTHIYQQSGTYTVCLRIQQRNPNGTLTNCIREICHNLTVQIPNTCNLVANFTISPVASTPNAFHFTNTSVPLNNTDSIRWTFGDGTSSNQVHPDHTYAQPGTYTVCLRIQQRNLNGTLSNCIREICHTIVVQGPTTCTLHASFTITGVSTSPFTYHFENTSTPLAATDSIRWTFGDGTSSNQLSPNHTYTAAGTYNVCLRVQKRNSNGTLSNCVSEICHTVIVQGPNNCNLVANFTISPVAATPNAFHFTNTSSPLNPADSIRWTFGDGTSSNDVNPTHTYAQPGTYNVCLRVQQRNPNGTLTNCVREICHPVTVQGSNTCNLVASFSVIAMAGTLNSFHFENTSTPLAVTDSIRWTFGDGTSSNQVSPNHTYAATGVYNVCLRIQKRNSNGTLSNCIREICHPVTVQGPTPTNCNLVANFTISPVPSTPNAFHFTNTSTPLNTTDSVRWTFGDGTSSNDFNPTHTYTQPGAYVVCLRVQQRNPNGTLTNCVREICHTIIVPGTNACNLHANFYSYRLFVSGTALPFLYHFVNTTTPLSPTDSIRWTFGDGTTSNEVNPNHAYNQPGTYNVCLRVIKRTSAGVLTNCVSEICHPLIVTALTPNTCSLQPYPNPVGNTVNVNVFLGIPEMIDVYVYNTSNIQVKEKHQAGVTGVNIVTLNTNDLLPGIYIMKVIHGNSICYATFVKI